MAEVFDVTRFACRCDLFALLVVYNRLGRVADQSKNICEDAIFTEAAS